jgi:hypothetical protein
MKSRLSLIFAALVVLLGAMAWVVLDRKTAPAPAIAAAPAPALERASALERAPTIATPLEPAAIQVAAAPPAPAPAPQVPSSPVVRVTASEETHPKYIAREGDTLSQLAIALLGADSKENRDAVIAANPTLQKNPDLVLVGQTYALAPRPAAPAPEAVKPAVRAAAQQPDAISTAPAADGPNLEYSAQPGDTVHALASSLLGGDTKVNRDAIIAENASLQRDPDHLVAGQSYTISPPSVLAADPNAAPAAAKIPTTRPDADDVVRAAMGRTLRYTAQPGDTVSKLAVVLMGSDTPANRDLIIKNNPTLVPYPHQLTAGRTYWIAAPTAASAEPTAAADVRP